MASRTRKEYPRRVPAAAQRPRRDRDGVSGRRFFSGFLWPCKESHRLRGRTPLAFRDNIEEEFTAKRVPGNVQGCVNTPHACSPLLGPSLCSPLPANAPLSNSLPLAGERTNEESNFKSLGEEADESLRELYIDAPATQNPLDDLFGKP